MASHFFNNDGAVSSFRDCGLPCGLPDSLCTLQPFRSVIAFTSSTAATLSTSGWLDLLDWDFHPVRDIQLPWRSSEMFIVRATWKREALL
jgi:hypothetical protein